MENTHVVTSVQNLQDSACSLYNNIVEGGEDIHHVDKIKDIKGNIIARWGGTCGRWDIS